MTSAAYVPTGVFPYVANSTPGPQLLQSDGDVLSETETFQANFAITAVSNTSPIRVTVTPAPNLATGAKVYIVGTSDANALGLQTVTKVSSTVFSLDGTTADGGAGAGGTLTPVDRGTLGKLLDAVEVIGTALGLSGGDASGDPLAIPVGVTFNNTVHMSGGDVTVSALIKLTGQKVLIRPRVVLSDADHSIDVSQGDVFQVPATTAALRTITLVSTSPVPQIGETMTVVTNGALQGAGTKRYKIAREDTTTVAEFWASTNEDICTVATFDWDGSEWRLGMNCGGGSVGGVVSG